MAVNLVVPTLRTIVIKYIADLRVVNNQIQVMYRGAKALDDWCWNTKAYGPERSLESCEWTVVHQGSSC